MRAALPLSTDYWLPATLLRHRASEDEVREALGQIVVEGCVRDEEPKIERCEEYLGREWDVRCRGVLPAGDRPVEDDRDLRQALRPVGAPQVRRRNARRSCRRAYELRAER